jgi:hypothetical protein
LKTTKIDIKSFATTMRESYEKTQKNNESFLLTGDCGTGKTKALETARMPIAVISFDPDGMSTIDHLLKEGKAIFDTSPETEAKDRTEKCAYEKFVEAFKRFTDADVFNNVGTFAIDSLTGLAPAALRWIGKTEGRWGGTPQRTDYMRLSALLEQLVRECCALPCDFIMTAHIGLDRDEFTGKIYSNLFVPGQSKVTIPTLFSQSLVTMCKTEDKKVSYHFLTVNDGFFKAKMRLASHTKFDTYEEPNIKKLRAKAGKPCEDLPLFK